VRPPGFLFTVFRLAVLAALAAAGCHHVGDPAGGDDDWDDDGPSSDGDGDGDADGDADADADGDSDSDADPIDDWVGLPCDDGDQGDAYCAQVAADADAFCFAWEGAPGGICTRECTPATYEMPVDGCNMDGVVCMDISHLTADTADDADGLGLCVRKCVPVSVGLPCPAPYIACDPAAWSFEAQFATCLLPKCQDDGDCPVDSGPACGGDDDCAVAEGEYCAGGTCHFDGACNTVSGLCSWIGDPSAELGDHCASSWDCPDNSRCSLPGADAYGKTVNANGMCTRSGCKAANTSSTNESGSPDPAIIARYGCGMLGTCHTGFPFGGLCFRRCAPTHDQAAFRCRQGTWDGDVLDASGDYDCYDMHQFGYPIFAEGNATLYPVASHPFCEGNVARCGDGETEWTSAECATYLANDSTWQLGMTCRDPATGANDPSGYCLDNTTSGPTESW
jgi:hypothetical protein